MTQEIIAASAYWASYLCNNDASGLTDAELATADAWLVAHGLERADFWFDSEPYFSWSYGFHTGADCRGGDLLDYIVTRRREVA
jgi:hypothetical protein